ncbi:MAG: hypothetical protein OEY59_03630 [Deltaproteobacteria bacterium]|nr:hypothetical protein [Deltaproteobacteria bacterium]
MTTINKKVDRPKIYTETDQILSDLTQELSVLKSRMHQLEGDQSKNNLLVEKMVFQETLTNDMIESQQKEIKVNKENYQIIANVMHDLKSPVSDVVVNLNGIISEIEDKETQETLRDCMETASNILETFNEVEDFCNFESNGESQAQEWADFREYFQSMVTSFNQSLDLGVNDSIHLELDSDLPQKGPIYKETIKVSLSNLLMELKNACAELNVTIRISSNHCGEKYGIDLMDITVSLESRNPLDLTWSDSWVDSVRQNQKKLVKEGFNLLKVRDLLRHSGGSLEVLKDDRSLKGFRFHIPLTY